MNIIKSILISTSIIAFTACGGGGSSTANNDAGEQTDNSNTGSGNHTQNNNDNTGGQTNSGNAVIGNAVISHFTTQILPETNIYYDSKNVRCPTLSRDGNTVYFGLDDEFIILDVGNPRNIRKLGSYKIKDGLGKIVLSTDDTKAHVTSDNKLIILDISDLPSIKEIGVYAKGGTASFWPKEIVLSDDGTKIYVANDARDSGGLDVLDVRNPKDIKRIGYDHITAGISIIGLSNDETRVYVLNSNSVFTLDISNLDYIKSLHAYSIETFNSYRKANNMVLSKDSKKAYITDGTKFIILDISDVENGPKEIGRVGDIENTYSMALSPDGKKAYVTDSYEGLTVVDISDARNPKILGYYNASPNYGSGIAISPDGTKAYLGNLIDNKIGLSIIDLTKPYRTTKKYGLK